MSHGNDATGEENEGGQSTPTPPGRLRSPRMMLRKSSSFGIPSHPHQPTPLHQQHQQHQHSKTTTTTATKRRSTAFSVYQLIQESNAPLQLRATIMSASVAGLFRIADQGEALVRAMAEASALVTKSVELHRGIPMTLAGDRFITLFCGSDSESRAVDAGLVIAEEKAKGEALVLHCGIATSPVWVGRMGSSSAWQSYGCHGAAVNIAVTLDHLGRRLGTSVLMDDATYQRAQYHCQACPAMVASYPKLLPFNRHHPELVAWARSRIARGDAETDEWMYSLQSQARAAGSDRLGRVVALMRRGKFADAAEALQCEPEELCQPPNPKLAAFLLEAAQARRGCEPL